MKEEINVPSVGESITTGVVAAWLKQSGEQPVIPLYRLFDRTIRIEVYLVQRIAEQRANFASQTFLKGNPRIAR